MIGWFKRWRQRKAKEIQLNKCRSIGHVLEKHGYGQDGKMVGGAPVPEGPETCWIMVCKCGYGEICDIGTLPYRRSYADGLKMMEEQNVKSRQSK